jgi:hypothetical protein
MDSVEEFPSFWRIGADVEIYGWVNSLPAVLSVTKVNRLNNRAVIPGHDRLRKERIAIMHGDVEALGVVEEFLKFEVRDIVARFLVHAREEVFGDILRVEKGLIHRDSSVQMTRMAKPLRYSLRVFAARTFRSLQARLFVITQRYARENFSTRGPLGGDPWFNGGSFLRLKVRPPPSLPARLRQLRGLAGLAQRDPDLNRSGSGTSGAIVMTRLTPVAFVVSVLALAIAAPAIAQHKGGTSAPHHAAPAQNHNSGGQHMQMPDFFFMPPMMQNQAQHRTTTAKPPHNTNNMAAAAHNNSTAAATHNTNALATKAGHTNATTGTAKAGHTNAMAGTAKTGHTSAGVATAKTGHGSVTAGTNSTFVSTPTGGNGLPTMHFPSEVSVMNTGLPTMNFPSEAFNFQMPTMNFPNNAFHFPASGLSLGAFSSFPTSASSGQFNATAGHGNANLGSSTIGMTLGMGSIVHGVHPTISYGHYYNYPGYSTYRNYTGSNLAQRHLQRVINDLDALQPGFNVGPYHQNTLKNDLMALTISGRRPSYNMVNQLSGDLAVSMARRGSSTINTHQLAVALRVVLNGGHLPTWETNQAIGYSQNVMLHGGLSAPDVQAVTNSMQAVVNQARSTQRSFNFNNTGFR